MVVGGVVLGLIGSRWGRFGGVEVCRLRPDDASYNFKEDMPAAEHVFAELQDDVPMTLLGKHAAYRVGLTSGDFKSWERGSDFPSLFATAKDQMNAFRESSPDIFYRVYPVPEDKRNDRDWVDNLPGGVLSRPYDPLLALHFVRPDLFAAKSVSGGRHIVVGNTDGEHGVPDGDQCRSELCRLVNQAADMMRKPVLLITDIGRDIDDTVALFTLRAAPAIDFVGVVTTGGATLDRAKQAR